MEENRLAWEAWQVLHVHGRPPGPLVAGEKGRQRLMVMPLEIKAAVSLLEAWDASREDLEKVLTIEQVVYKSLN